jgi:serine/threonine protein kinase
MNPTATCSECGKPLPAGSDVCPACLMAQAIASRTLDEEEGPGKIPPLSPEEMADKFPQFEILECLGRGGMGVVYKARQKSLNRLVAIKILAPERDRDARFAGRFAKEAELLAKLSHPHIVTIHDFGETGGLYFLVMEFVNGVNLRGLLREGKMAPEQALAIVPPICDALQFAHNHGIVHRDIKPENILLDREGRVKIADFGIATLAGDAAERAGTPDYMAPEQSAGAKTIDHRADIYALGVVLYEMLTGERPTTFPVAPSHRVQIDVRLDEVVLRALAHQPERRFQSVGEFNTVLGEVTRPAATTSTRPDPLGRLRLLLHFAPAILLIIAWFSSGLERGAVLLLSVLLTAVLVLKAVAQRNSAAASSDGSAR